MPISSPNLPIMVCPTNHFYGLRQGFHTFPRSTPAIFPLQANNPENKVANFNRTDRFASGEKVAVPVCQKPGRVWKPEYNQAAQELRKNAAMGFPISQIFRTTFADTSFLHF
ncbi:MAG: hypothetical protein ACR2MD_05585 [Aridibacter sp.]